MRKISNIVDELLERNWADINNSPRYRYLVVVKKSNNQGYLGNSRHISRAILSL